VRNDRERAKRSRLGHSRTNYWSPGCCIRGPGQRITVVTMSCQTNESSGPQIVMRGAIRLRDGPDVTRRIEDRRCDLDLLDSF
jgi:hypothetical protein